MNGKICYSTGKHPHQSFMPIINLNEFQTPVKKVKKIIARQMSKGK